MGFSSNPKYTKLGMEIIACKLEAFNEEGGRVQVWSWASEKYPESTLRLGNIADKLGRKLSMQGGGGLRGRAGGRLKLQEEEEGASFEVEQVSPPAAASSTSDFKALLFPQVLDPGSKVV